MHALRRATARLSRHAVLATLFVAWMSSNVGRLAAAPAPTVVPTSASASTSPRPADFLLQTQLSIDDVTVTEGNSGTVEALFTLTLNETNSNDVTVEYATANGSATLANGDYAAASGVATIPAGELSTTVSVQVNGDAVREGDEQFVLDLSNADQAEIADGQGVGTITNDDGVPSLSIDDVAVTEGNAGTVNAVFTVSLSHPVDQAVTVDYATADSTATLLNGDYTAASGTLTIPAKASSGTVTVTVSGDQVREADERFHLALANPTNATLADSLGVGTITNDDGVPSLAIDDVTVTEGDAGTVNATFTVSLSHPSDQAVTVDWATADSTATLLNGDYQAGSGTLTFPAKSTAAQTLTVVVNGDLVREGDERFKVDLSAPSNATLGDFRGVGAITNDDGVPSLAIDDVTVTEGDAGTVNATFTVSLSHASDQAVTVDWATADSTATLANGDYQAGSGTLTFPAKTTAAQTLTVLVNGDLVLEADERFKVTLSDAANATLADFQGVGTILNDDGVPSLTIDDVSVTEGNAGTVNATFTVSLSNPTDQPVSVSWATSDSTATLANDDYQAASGTLVIPAKAPSGTITVVVNGDLVRESHERFKVDLDTPVNATIADSRGVGTITNDDGVPTLAIDDVAVTEGGAGTVNATFTVSLSNPSDQTVTVNWATADSTATILNGDYVAGSGTLTFPAKTTAAQTLTVTVNGDLVREGDERFKVDLSAPANATLGDFRGIGTITNDDGLPSLAIDDVTVTEGDAGTVNATFTVSLSHPSDQAVTVNWATADSTASLLNGDYVAGSGTLTFPAKTTAAQTLTVVVNGDLVRESDERFKVNLSGAANATLGDFRGVGTITNDDGVPSLAIDDVTVTEGNAGTVNATFTVSLSHPTDQPVSVTYATADSTATLANNDYQARSGTLVIPAKMASGTITVPVNGDLVREGDERFKLDLSAPANATIADFRGVATITNDDGNPTLAINDVSVTEGSAGTVNATFTVSLSNPTDQPVSVSWASSDSTATLANDDYQAASGTLVIPAKAPSGTVTVVVNGDLVRESNERFKVDLSAPVNATITDFRGVGTITNDDGLPSLAIDDASVTEGNAGTVIATFTVSLSNPSDQPIGVSWATADSTATLLNGDYVAASGTLAFPAKSTAAQTLTVTVNGDLVREGNERFKVDLSAPVNATLGDFRGIGTILNDDGLPSASIDDVTVTEGDAGTVNATFTVSLSHPSDQPVSVTYATADSTARASNADFQTRTGTLVIPAKTLSATIAVPVNGDVVLESDELFKLDLSAPVNATIADFRGIGKIVNDDVAPTLAIADVTVTEGSTGTTNAVFTLTLSNPTDQPVSVDYATSDSTATLANNDYQARSGTLVIPAKSPSATITVPVTGDLVREGNEVFKLDLTNPVNVALADARAIGTITNDDGMPSLSIGNDNNIAEGDAGTVNAVFTVTLSNPTDQPVSVNWTTGDSTATAANNDYQAASGTLVIPAKTSSATITVLVNGDVTREGDERFKVDLSAPVNATIADFRGVGRILDDDDVPTLSIADVTVTEGNAGSADAVFTVSLSNPTDLAVSVSWATSDSTATLANGDYQARSGTLVIPPKAPSGTVAVPVNGDLVREGNEVFKVSLTSPVNATIADFRGIGTIANDDGQPGVSIDDVTVTEGNAGTVNAVFTVSLSNPSDQTVSVAYATADSTATLANGDYQARSGTVVIAAKTSSATITVPVNGDLVREGNEFFKVNLGAPVNATIADFRGIGTITNDDGLPSLAINDATVTEGNAGTVNATFTVTLSNPTDQPVSVGWATADSTATTANNDYQAASGTLVIPPKTSSGTITVLVNGDLVRESAERFKLDLSAPANATIADFRGVGTITNDDGVPTLAINDVSVTEGNAGAVNATFTVSLSHPTDQPVSVSWASADSTASLLNNDYQAASGTLVIPAKAPSGTITVLVNGDLVRESHERFKVDLSAPVNATIADFRGVGTITNDDPVPTLAIGDVTVNEGDGGPVDAVFTVTLSHPTDQTVTVAWASADSTALLANGDYAAASGTAVISPKTLTAAVTVVVNGDRVREGDEAFVVNLSAPAGATLADAQGIGTIVDEDGLPSVTVDDVILTEGNLGLRDAIFTVRLSNPTDEIVIVEYATSDSTATLANGDYDAASGTLQIPAKATQATIVVPVHGDLVMESEEHFLLDLDVLANATLFDGHATAAIRNDDGVPTITLLDATVLEGHTGLTPLAFTVSLSNPTDQPVQVSYATADGTARLANNDYVAASGVLVIPPKAPTGTIVVSVRGDATREGNEILLLNLSAPVNATIADGVGIGTVQNDDGSPSLSIADTVRLEGDAGTANATFTVTLSHPTDQVVTVGWATADSTATVANADYQAASGTLTIPPKTSAATISVPVRGDLVTESDEAFLVLLSGPANATIADGKAAGVIQNDDGLPSLAIGDVSVTEGNSGTTLAAFAVTLSQAVSQAVTVAFATTDSTATLANGDYQATTGVLTIPAKTTSGVITVPVAGDVTMESLEVFRVTLSSPANATLADAVGLGSIENDDTMPSLSIGNVAVTEGNAGTTVATFTVTLSTPTDRQVTVEYATQDGSARIADADYQAAAGTLILPPKTTSGTIAVPVLGDGIREPDETFLVQLSAPSEATLGVTAAIGTIGNDDPIPAVAIANAAMAEGDAGDGSLAFTVTVSHLTHEVVTVGWSTADSTATLGNGDYQAASGTALIPAYAASTTVSVPVRGDVTRESDEAFLVTLASPVHATLGNARGVGTIVNDDGVPSLSIADASIVEGDAGVTQALFQVTLSSPTDQPVTVQYATADSTATLANGDYQAASGVLTIPAKSAGGTIAVAVNGDGVLELDEAFLMTLAGPTNATLADPRAAGVIGNDDDTPYLSVADAEVVEGDAGTTSLVFTVTLDHATDRTVTVDWSAVDGTATLANGDYLAGGGTVSIPPKTLSGTFAVAVKGDTVHEPDEFLLVALANSGNAAVAVPVAIGTIRNDDALHAVFQQRNAGFTNYFQGTIAPSWGDYDSDGDIDLPLYRNDGRGQFTEIPGFRNLLGGNYHGSSWGDWNKDGRLDLAILTYAATGPRTLLLENHGNGNGGIFTDQAPALGLDVQGFGETALWADFNLDGWPDLFAPYYSHVAPFQSFMYYNDGTGGFVDVSDAVGVALRNIPEALKVEGADVADWDDDGDLDFYAASHLFINDGTGLFTDVRAAVGLPLRFDEGAAFVDYDNDGDMDLYLRHTDSPRLYRNDAGAYVDVTAAAGILPSPFLWGDSWADVDNDGDVDLLTFGAGEPARLMLNRGDGTFAPDPGFEVHDIQTGLSAWGDMDNDGDLDVVTGASPVPILLENLLDREAGFANSAIRVRVVDEAGRETEHGAMVRLRKVGGPVQQVQTRAVGGGASYLNRNEYIVHFGVTDQGPYALDVRFPSPANDRVIVNSTVATVLGAIVPTKLDGKTIVVYRDGRVDFDDRPFLTPVAHGSAPSLALMPVAPNPIKGEAAITFRMPARGEVTLAVYDLGGRLVRTLASGTWSAGTHVVHWDRADDQGELVRAGVYFYALTVDGRSGGRQRAVVLR